MRFIFESFTEKLIFLSALLAVCIVSTSFAADSEPQNSPESVDSFPSASITFPPMDETTLSLGGAIGFGATVTGGNPPLTYLWDFDGGAENSTLLDPGSILFSDPGMFTVTFTVTDADGDQDSDSMIVRVEGIDKKPVAEIISPREDVTITAGQSVHFAAEAQGGNAPLSYRWDFDGITEDGAHNNPFHPPRLIPFPDPGIYTVTFTAWDYDDDADSDSVRVTVNPVDVDTKPVITMIWPESDVTILEGQIVSFFSLVHKGNPPFEYKWNFGDPTENFYFENPPRPIYFDQVGIFTVTFTVTDADGDTDIFTRIIRVKPTGQRPIPVSIDDTPIDPIHGTTLQVEPFADSVDGYIHDSTRWQVSEKEGFSALTLDTRSEVYLTEIPLPVLLLKPEVRYFWRAKFFDDDGNESEWSNTASFFTGTWDGDANGNGIMDTLEVNEAVDLDRNGRPDRVQEDIKCIRTAGESTIAGVKLSPEAGNLEALHSVDPDLMTGQYNGSISLPIGLIAFRADTATSGHTVEFTIYLSHPVSDDTGWFEFNGTDGWSDFSDDVVSKEEGRTITLNLRDGGIGDADGTENGTIVHSSGPGTPYADIDESPNSSGSGCFIRILSHESAAFQPQTERITKGIEAFLNGENHRSGTGFYQGR